MKELIKRIKSFFKDVWDAVIKLFGGKSRKTETTTTKTTEYNEDGSVKSETITKTESPTSITWRGLWKKFTTKVREGIDYAIEHPLKVLGISGASGWSVLKIFNAINEAKRTIISPFQKRKEKYESDRKIWDNKTHMWYSLKRPLKQWENNYVSMEIAAHGRLMYDVLSELGVLV